MCINFGEGRTDEGGRKKEGAGGRTSLPSFRRRDGQRRRRPGAEAAATRGLDGAKTREASGGSKGARAGVHRGGVINGGEGPAWRFAKYI